MGESQAATSRLKKMSFFWPEFHNVFPYFFLEKLVNFLKKIRKKHDLLTTPTRYWEAAFRIVVFFLFFKQSHACFSLKNKQKAKQNHACFASKNKQKYASFRLIFWGFGTLPKTAPARRLPRGFPGFGQLAKFAF